MWLWLARQDTGAVPRHGCIHNLGVAVAPRYGTGQSDAYKKSLTQFEYQSKPDLDPTELVDLRGEDESDRRMHDCHTLWNDDRSSKRDLNGASTTICTML
ncbi:hypothetical protein Tco_0890358 [Tanacetum coccineum]|uniref:Uncharacterized protein n=1 Tax=Tanacetum coccineum TaxID=301880 RepID=A0ABQ5BZW6_9ASTR